MLEYYDMYIFVTRLIYVVICLKTRPKMATMAILLYYIDLTSSTMARYVSTLSSHHLPHIRYRTSGLDHGDQLFSVTREYENFAKIVIWFHKYGLK